MYLHRNVFPKAKSGPMGVLLCFGFIPRTSSHTGHRYPIGQPYMCGKVLVSHRMLELRTSHASELVVKEAVPNNMLPEAPPSTGLCDGPALSSTVSLLLLLLKSMACETNKEQKK